MKNGQMIYSSQEKKRYNGGIPLAAINFNQHQQNNFTRQGIDLTVSN